MKSIALMMQDSSRKNTQEAHPSPKSSSFQRVGEDAREKVLSFKHVRSNEESAAPTLLINNKTTATDSQNRQLRNSKTLQEEESPMQQEVTSMTSSDEY